MNRRSIVTNDAVALRIIVGPARAAVRPVAAAEPEPPAGIHQAADHELRGDVPVRRDRRGGVRAFEARVLAKRHLRGGLAIRQQRGRRPRERPQAATTCASLDSFARASQQSAPASV